jgi:BioD-like phosphotransacetylase family protein
MGELHSSDAPLFMNEPDDSTQHLDVPVIPDAEILRTDPSLGEDRCCLSKYQSSAADCATSEMNQVPVSSVSILARILTHRRDEHPIDKV